MTHGLRTRPRSTAFFASSPAPIITAGLDVFVHEVIAAITTAPWSISTVSPSIVSSTAVRSTVAVSAGASLASIDSASASSTAPLPSATPNDGSAAEKALRASRSGIRSCGRRGPAIDGSTVERSSSTTCEYVGCSSGSCQSPFSLQ